MPDQDCLPAGILLGQHHEAGHPGRRESSSRRVTWANVDSIPGAAADAAAAVAAMQAEAATQGRAPMLGAATASPLGESSSNPGSRRGSMSVRLQSQLLQHEPSDLSHYMRLPALEVEDAPVPSGPDSPRHFDRPGAPTPRQTSSSDRLLRRASSQQQPQAQDDLFKQVLRRAPSRGAAEGGSGIEDSRTSSPGTDDLLEHYQRHSQGVYRPSSGLKVRPTAPTPRRMGTTSARWDDLEEEMDDAM